MTKLSVTAYIYITLAAIILALGYYCHVLNNENDDLISQKATVEQVNKDQVVALNSCTDSTKDLKTKQDQQTEAAKVAVAQAKIDAVNDYKSSQAVLFRKPKTPVVTKDNAKQYGGTDPVGQLQDYLQTQDLANDYIDKRDAAKAGATK